MSEDQGFRQHGLFGVVVDLPTWLRDETWYCFEASPPDESRLTIEIKDGRTDTCQSLIERRREGLVLAYPSDGEFGVPEPVRDSELPALHFRSRIPDFAGAIEICAVELGQQSLVLCYGAADPEDVAAFASLLGRLRRIGDERGQPPPGFTSRCVAGLVLEVPSKLLPPTKFSFRGDDVALRIELSESARLDPDVERQLNFQDEEEWWLERPTESYAASTEHTRVEWQVRCVLASTAAGVQKYRLDEGIASFEQHLRRVHVIATARDHGCELLDNSWQRFLFSLRSDS